MSNSLLEGLLHDLLALNCLFRASLIRESGLTCKGYLEKKNNAMLTEIVDGDFLVKTKIPTNTKKYLLKSCVGCCAFNWFSGGHLWPRTRIKLLKFSRSQRDGYGTPSYFDWKGYFFGDVFGARSLSLPCFKADCWTF